MFGFNKEEYDKRRFVLAAARSIAEVLGTTRSVEWDNVWGVVVDGERKTGWAALEANALGAAGVEFKRDDFGRIERPFFKPQKREHGAGKLEGYFPTGGCQDDTMDYLAWLFGRLAGEGHAEDSLNTVRGLLAAAGWGTTPDVTETVDTALEAVGKSRSDILPSTRIPDRGPVAAPVEGEAALFLHLLAATLSKSNITGRRFSPHVSGQTVENPGAIRVTRMPYDKGNTPEARAGAVEHVRDLAEILEDFGFIDDASVYKLPTTQLVRAGTKHVDGDVLYDYWRLSVPARPVEEAAMVLLGEPKPEYVRQLKHDGHDVIIVGTEPDAEFASDYANYFYWLLGRVKESREGLETPRVEPFGEYGVLDPNPSWRTNPVVPVPRDWNWRPIPNDVVESMVGLVRGDWQKQMVRGMLGPQGVQSPRAWKRYRYMGSYLRSWESVLDTLERNGYEVAEIRGPRGGKTTATYVVLNPGPPDPKLASFVSAIRSGVKVNASEQTLIKYWHSLVRALDSADLRKPSAHVVNLVRKMMELCSMRYVDAKKKKALADSPSAMALCMNFSIQLGDEKLFDHSMLFFSNKPEQMQLVVWAQGAKTMSRGIIDRVVAALSWDAVITWASGGGTEENDNTTDTYDMVMTAVVNKWIAPFSKNKARANALLDAMLTLSFNRVGDDFPSSRMLSYLAGHGADPFRNECLRAMSEGPGFTDDVLRFLVDMKAGSVTDVQIAIESSLADHAEQDEIQTAVSRLHRLFPPPSKLAVGAGFTVENPF